MTVVTSAARWEAKALTEAAAGVSSVDLVARLAATGRSCLCKNSARSDSLHLAMCHSRRTGGTRRSHTPHPHSPAVYGTRRSLQ